jgi:lysophospholipase L1-like esterase
MKRRFTIALFGLLLVFQSSARSAPAEHDFAKWEKAIAAFEKQDQDSPPPKHEILFTGASTIARWKTLQADFPNHKVINRGFGGSEILDCTHFADRIVFPYEPRMIFLRSGGNDIHNGKTGEQAFADFKDFVATVHAKLPETEILFISQNPTLARWEQRDQEQILNDRVKELAEHTPHLKFIDVSKMVLGDDGKPRMELFVADKLHFNDAGNKLLAEHVRPYLPKEK